MTLEIARRLGQDGVTWETVVVDEDTGGGLQPVTCVLELQPDVHDAGSIPLKWEDLYNNSFDFDPLAAIPDGLGLSFSFDGTDNIITATEAGVWAFHLGFAVAADATWKALLSLDLSLYAQVYCTADPSGSSTYFFSLSETVNVSAGWTLDPSVNVDAPATADPLFADCYLNIVRLG